MYKKILVPIDGSPVSNCGLEEAIGLAKDQGASLRLFHLVDEFVAVSGPEGAGLYAGDMIEFMRQDGMKLVEKAKVLAQSQGVAAEAVMVESFGGRAADHIVRQAKKWGADLIALGTHGRRGVKRMVMGSDAEQVVRTSPVPVLLVRSKRKAVSSGKRTRNNASDR